MKPSAESRAAIQEWFRKLRAGGFTMPLANERTEVEPFEVATTEGKRISVHAVEWRDGRLVLHGHQVIDTIVLTTTVGGGGS